MVITEEQRREIERKKAVALELRQSRERQAASSFTHQQLAPSLSHAVRQASVPSVRQPSGFGNSSSSFYVGSSFTPVSPILAIQRFHSVAPAGVPDAKRAPIQKIVAKAVLLSSARFEVKSAYSDKLIHLMKTFKSHQYDFVKRSWSLAFTDYGVFDSTVRSALKDYIDWEGFPKCVVGVFMKGLNLITRVPEPTDLEQRIPPHLYQSLLPYQLDGVKFAIKNNGRVLIADDMGLGKTIQAIATAAYYRNDSWPVLCVCPSSMRFEWREQWLKWIKGLDESDVAIITDGRQTNSIVGTKIVVITYDLLVSMAKQCMNKFLTIIFDESHSIKNGKAQRTKIAVDISASAKCVILLSGTPALSRPQELYSQISVINKDLFKPFQEFGVRYCNGHLKFGHWDYSGVSNAEELQLVMENTIMIRRLKSDVAFQLPLKRRETVILDPADVRSKMKELESSASEYAMIKSSNYASQVEIRQSLFLYYQHTGRAKLPAVIRYIKDSLEGDSSSKVVVFAHHLDVIEGLFDAFSAEYGAVCIRGATAGQKRKQDVDTFQTSPSCRVAVLSIGACSTGITMTAASVVFFAELYWNPGILMQAEDRLHRIGQQNNVTVKYLIAKGTADDDLWYLLQRKLDFLNGAGLNKDNFRSMDTSEQKTAVPQVLETLFDQMLLTEEQSIEIANVAPRESSPKRMRLMCSNPADKLMEDDPDDELFANIMN